AWSVHAFHVWSGGAEPREKRRRLLHLTLCWVALFGVELLVLRHNTPAGRPSRIGAALHALAEPGRTAGTLAHAFVDTGVLLAAGAVLAVFLVSPRRLFAAAVFATPVLVTLVVASQPYAGLAVLERGPSWAPRFALLWGLLAFACLAGIASGPPRALRRRTLVAFVIASIVAQYGALRWRRSYAVEDRLSWGRLTRGEGSFGSSLSPRERETLACLGRRLPPEIVVRTNHPLFAIFERQDVVWPDHPAENTWTGGYPQVTVCDIAGRTFPDGCVDWIRQLPADGFQLVRVDGFEVAYGRSVAGAVEECGAGTRK
ncbi:MAG TPA: hypothetical protein VGR00_05745, partial [Thermoanaerobaculia bacterium]|nr:hypothetical protein [Thermoanaerobaculia bacterium]